MNMYDVHHNKSQYLLVEGKANTFKMYCRIVKDEVKEENSYSNVEYARAEIMKGR